MNTPSLYTEINGRLTYTPPMKQNEATKERPFYSVSYQYERNPWTNYSCNNFSENPISMNSGGRTMPGTDSLELAKLTADRLALVPYIRFAYVHKTESCYNHKQVYCAENKEAKP